MLQISNKSLKAFPSLQMSFQRRYLPENQNTIETLHFKI